MRPDNEYLPNPRYIYDLLFDHGFNDGEDVSAFHALWVWGRGPGEVARLLAGESESAVECDLDDFLRYQASSPGEQVMWVAMAGEWVQVLPAAGKALRESVLVELSEMERQALEIYWDTGGNERFAYAVDGAVLTKFSFCFPDFRSGADSGVLDSLMTGLNLRLTDPDEDPGERLVEFPESVTSAFVLAGRVTGHLVDAEWLSGVHTRYSIT